jgi:type III restriction enzyme
MTQSTQEARIPIVVIIDEEHLFWSKTADKSKVVLDRINPKVEIRVSATPKTHADYTVTIPRDLVVREEMIKKQVILNPNFKTDYHTDEELNENLIRAALAKRNEIAKAYKALGMNINPLLLIQLPNDTSESMTAEDTKIADHVKQYLKVIHNIDEQNGKLAIWLSNEKANLPNLEKEDNLAEVLLFKQAIALGWDCPRAAVLLIFRKLQSNIFTVQTVGRILRMPEQKFYTNNLLNIGYVYTDISREKIEIVADDMEYLNKDTIQATRRDNLNNVSLLSYYSEIKSSDRNRLGPDFKKVLIDTFINTWLLDYQPALFAFDDDNADDFQSMPESTQKASARNRERVSNKIRLDVRNINVEIPTDMVFQNDLGVIEASERHKFARSMGEVNLIFLDYCRSLLGAFEKSHSTDVLVGYLCDAMEELFDIFETDAKKVILFHGNRPKFTDIINKALDRYKARLQQRQQQARARSFQQYTWEVPADRLYKQNTHDIQERIEDHALLPFVELKTVSSPEKKFTAFLEDNKQYIDWWYKNGDEGKQHYSIPYINSQGEKSLFYVDYIIRMNNGNIYLFDTKSEASDPEAPNKHNALLSYIEKQESNMKGGVIIENNGVWYYSQYPIENTTDLGGWDAYFPNEA